jgi:hypothetical protein
MHISTCDSPGVRNETSRKRAESSCLAWPEGGSSTDTTSVIALLHLVTGFPARQKRTGIKPPLTVCFFLMFNTSGNSHFLFVTIFPNEKYILDIIYSNQTAIFPA